jgi:hypothetical protein
MTHTRNLLASVAALSLLFGIDLPDPKLTGEHFPLPDDQMVAGLDANSPAQPAFGCMQERSCASDVYD